MALTHPGHPHKLALKHANHPYYCWGCDQLGFGLSYVCDRSGCNFFLHKQCGNPQPRIRYPFSNQCELTLRNGGSGEGSLCDACGKKIRRLHYRCLCSFVKRNLHPSCVGHEATLGAADGLTLYLKKEATTKCLHCGNRDLRFRVSGWAYVSSCGNYCYHVSCVMEVINMNWKNGFFTGENDPFQTIKQQFPGDVDRMQLVAVRKRNRAVKKQATAMLSILLHVFTGNHLGLVGTAVSYFSN